MQTRDPQQRRSQLRSLGEVRIPMRATKKGIKLENSEIGTWQQVVRNTNKRSFADSIAERVNSKRLLSYNRQKRNDRDRKEFQPARIVQPNMEDG